MIIICNWYNKVPPFFYLTHSRGYGRIQKTILFVLVLMRTKEFASEIYWPLYWKSTFGKYVGKACPPKMHACTSLASLSFDNTNMLSKELKFEKKPKLKLKAWEICHHHMVGLNLGILWRWKKNLRAAGNCILLDEIIRLCPGPWEGLKIRGCQ